MYNDKEVTPMLVFAIFSAVLGMFQFGFNTGVINAPQKVLEEFIANIYKNRTGNWISEELRDVIWSLTVSVFAVGGMIGGIVAPMVANWCGRKTGLVLNNTVAVLGVTLMSSSQLAQSIECLILGRLFIGLNCGLNTALVPMYLSEISTVNLRGALGTVSQLGVTVGLLSSQILGLKDILGTKDYWPFLFGIAFIPAVLQLIMLPFCPESPRYLLLTCGRISEARHSLRRLRNTTDVEDDIEEMRAEERAQQEEIQRYGKLSSVRELFNHPWLRAPLIIGIMMQLSQQFSGINAIFYYSTDIFLSAEVPEDYAVYATMGVGATMVITTLVSMPLMDRLGRRTLHLHGLAGMFLASIFLTISLLVKFLYDWMKYISVISILSYTLFFGIGPGSIPLMITAELFTQGTRPAAMSVSVLTNWFANFVVGLTFPLMKRVLQNYLFLPFTVLLAIFWIFTYKNLPETKNRTFEEIAALFRPIQMSGAGRGGFPDYGCTLSSIGNPGQTEVGSENQGAATCPDQLENSGQTGHFNATNNSNGPGAFKYDRLRFDGSTTRNICNTGDMISSYRGSQGNIHHNCARLAQGSCASIPQNISTSDQQPLIVDLQHHDHHNCQQHKSILLTNHYLNEQKNNQLNYTTHHQIHHHHQQYQSHLHRHNNDKSHVQQLYPIESEKQTYLSEGTNNVITDRVDACCGHIAQLETTFTDDYVAYRLPNNCTCSRANTLHKRQHSNHSIRSCRSLISLSTSECNKNHDDLGFITLRHRRPNATEEPEDVDDDDDEEVDDSQEEDDDDNRNGLGFSRKGIGQESSQFQIRNRSNSRLSQQEYEHMNSRTLTRVLKPLNDMARSSREDDANIILEPMRSNVVVQGTRLPPPPPPLRPPPPPPPPLVQNLVSDRL